MTIPEPVRKFKEIQEVLTRCNLEFETIKSPRDAYEEKVMVVNASIEEAWKRVSSHPDPSDLPSLQNEIVEYGGQLKELEIKHNATIYDEERAYEQKLLAAMERLCNDLIKTIGPSLAEKSLHALSNRQSRQRDRDGPSNGLAMPTSTSQKTRQPELSHSAQLHKSAPGAGSVENGVIHVCIGKRKDSSTSSSREQKHRRIESEQPNGEAKSIDFEKVFQDGCAPTKHVLVPSPTEVDAWYILRCAEHDLSFRDNPMESAAVHLGSEEHGRLPQEPAVVIEHLGVQVLGCDKTLAEKNNAVALKAFRSRYEQSRAHSRPTRDHVPSQVSKTPRRPTRQSRRRHGDSSQLRDQEFEGIIDPTPGEVYLAFWKKSKEWSAVLLLPMSNLDDVGVPETFEHLGLADNVPACYDYDIQSDSLQWRQGYKDGEYLVAKREFPIMYFDGQDFPAKSAVGWVAAEDLRTLDTNTGPSLVPYYQSVRKFLNHRVATRSMETEVAKADASGTILPDGVSP